MFWDSCRVLRFLAWPEPGEITYFCHVLPLSTCYAAADNKRRVFIKCGAARAVWPGSQHPEARALLCSAASGASNLRSCNYFLLRWGNLIAFILLSVVSQPGWWDGRLWIIIQTPRKRQFFFSLGNWAGMFIYPEENVAYFPTFWRKNRQQLFITGLRLEPNANFVWWLMLSSFSLCCVFRFSVPFTSHCSFAPFLFFVSFFHDWILHH